MANRPFQNNKSEEHETSHVQSNVTRLANSIIIRKNNKEYIPVEPKNNAKNRKKFAI